MYKIINIFMIVLTIFFIFITFRYYLSNKNISNKDYNRVNIDEILKEKLENLPVLKSDTYNVIEFNNSLENKINDNKKRSFWDLLRNKWNVRH